MRTPLVSVVIDTYNYGRFVDEAIQSALAQDFPKDQMEILVVDDGSTDDTPERIKKYGDAVGYCRKQNGGQASAFNFGIAQTKGEIVAFLDGDDVWMPKKISRVASAFERNWKAVMVYHKFQFWDPNSVWEWEPGTPDVSGEILGDRRKVLDYVAAPTSSLAFRRHALERVLPVPESMRFMADAYLVGTAIFLGPIDYVGECLASNRVHGANLWFAERGQPSRELLQRRVAMRREVIKSLRRWIESNGPRVPRRNARAYMCLWDLLQETDEFQIERPGRWREFVHLYREALATRPIVSTANFGYRFAKALAVLVAGRRATVLEGVRTRVKRYWRRDPVGTKTTGETGRA